MVTVIDFIKMFAEKDDALIDVTFEWFWQNEGIDEEYSFEGKPSEFVEKYTEHYDNLDGWDISDMDKVVVERIGCHSKIYIAFTQA